MYMCPSQQFPDPAHSFTLNPGSKSWVKLKICCFYRRLPKSKKIITQFSLDILQIQCWELITHA